MKVLVLGSNGLVGNSIVKIFNNESAIKKVFASSRKDTNLFDFSETKAIEDTKPDIIINAAAKVGGIKANNESGLIYLKI